MYTGNHRDEQWNRYCQMIAKVQNNGAITKFDAPVIPSQPEGYKVILEILKYLS